LREALSDHPAQPARASRHESDSLLCPRHARIIAFPIAGELRDVSKPIAYDEHGNPLYAPRGLILRSPRSSGVDPMLVGRKAQG
jgi:hypothetical protein